MNYRVLLINLSKKRWEIKDFDFSGWVEAGIYFHFDEFKSCLYPVFSEKNVIFLGRGPFSGSALFGTNRCGFVFRSPLSKILHFSEMGAFGIYLGSSGLDGILLYGKSRKPSILRVVYKDTLEVEFLELSKKELYSIYRKYRNEEGTYALSLWIYERFREDFKKFKRIRSLVVGPASWKTLFGCVASIGVSREGEIVYGMEDFAGRGGPGSVLAQAHNVAGILVGGNLSLKSKIKELENLQEFNSFFKSKIGEDYLSFVKDCTKKYRFDTKLGAGGTFGCNYPQYRDWLPAFGYNHIYLKKPFREKLYRIIYENFWLPFKKEVFEERKNWKTCGEPCPVACKKVFKDHKVDYEPFHAAGPLIGIYTVEDSAEVVKKIDALGFDAIEAGHLISWTFDLITKGLLLPEEVGLPHPPNFNPLSLNPEKWRRNKEFAIKILEGLINGKKEFLKVLAKEGIRKTGFVFSQNHKDRVEKLGLTFNDLAIYQPYGEDGYMTPNLYWTLGFLVPIFVTGKYWTEYSILFLEPEEFAEVVFERCYKEFALSNAGICRFHRKAIECILEILYEWAGVKNFEEKFKNLYRKIIFYAIKAFYGPKPLETQKSFELFFSLIDELEIKKMKDKCLRKGIKEVYRDWYLRFVDSFLNFFNMGERDEGK